MKNKTRKKVVRLKVNHTAMHWRNPVTGNLVGYVRALTLSLTKKKNVEHGIKDPNSGKLLTLIQAIRRGLVQVAT